MTRFTWLALVALAAFACTKSSLAADTAPVAPMTAAADQSAEKIGAYVARFGRNRPVVAVVGENSGTVLADFVIPYGVLSQSGVADVVSVATRPGTLKMPPLQIQPDSTVVEFDHQFPDGADYVFVPAVSKQDDPTLLAWISAQAQKGATMVSICNGSQVLANAGLTRGHRATGHWSTYQSRVETFPDTQWVKNRRYVVDGKIVSSAGISAALPASLALVEAIGGTERANALAVSLGVTYWGPRHNSDAFHLTTTDILGAYTSAVFRAKKDVGVPVATGVDEIALALTAGAYSATLRSRVYAVAQSEATVRTRGGLMLVPDRVVGKGKPLDWIVPEWDATPSGQVLDKAIADIAVKFGTRAARFVALEAEHPWQGL